LHEAERATQFWPPVPPSQFAESVEVKSRPEDLEPTQPMRDSTSFRSLSGRWIWTGNQHVWQPGVWIYDFSGLVLVPFRFAMRIRLAGDAPLFASGFRA